MAVTFKTKAAGDVTMLDANAKHLFGIIGKDLGERGVITAQDAAQAASSLRAAIAAQGGDKGPDEEKDPEGARAYVPLKTRAQPLIEMLENAHAKGTDILWGV